MFAQTAVLLLDRPWPQPELERALQALPLRAREDTAAAHPDDTSYWMRGDAQVLVNAAFHPRATVAVEAFEAPWPDSMGNPETEPGLFGAWALRWFGSGTFPHALRRACMQPSSATPGEGGAKHAAFVRLNLHYLAGAGPDDLVFPEVRDVQRELQALAQVAAALASDARSLAWFVPPADLLVPAENARPLLERQASGEFASELWVSMRSLNGSNRMLFETVGLSALQRTDHQVILEDPSIPFERVYELLRQLAFETQAGVEPGPTLGPGGRWFPTRVEGEGMPPRDLVRWSTSESEQAALYTELSKEQESAWTTHLEQFLGPVDLVWHELMSDRVHLDVLLFRARGERRHHVLVTQGMSALPMNVPAGAEQFRFAELMLALPDSWPLDEDGLKKGEHYWPVRQLKLVARLPHACETWIAWGHTIPNGEQAEAYAPDTKLCCALVGTSSTLPEAAWTAALGDEKTVHLWALHFIHEDEMNKKLELGAEALFERLRDRGVDERLSKGRRSAYAKRFWVV